MNKKNSFLFLSLIFVSIFTCHGMEETLSVEKLSREEIQHLLLNNPLAISKPLNTYRREFEQQNIELSQKKIDSLKEYAQQLKSLDHTYKSKFPLLWTMGECAINDCPMTRHQNPFLREAFETKASQLLLQALENKPDQLITYTSFGCGAALSELIIFTKTLHQCPTAHLNIHMIDIHHNYSVGLRTSTSKTQQIDPTAFNYDYYYEQLKTYLLAYDSSLTPLYLIKMSLFCMIYSEYRLHVMSSWLQTQFPNAHVSFFIHATVDAYCEYLQQNALSHADVVTSVDVQDDGGRMQFSSYNYHLLCSKTLQHNPSSTNVWLDHDNIDTFGLFTLSAKQTSEDQKTIQFDCHPEALTVYKALERLYTLP